MGEKKPTYEKKKPTEKETGFSIEAQKREQELRNEILCKIIENPEEIDAYMGEVFLSPQAINNRERHEDFLLLLGTHPKKTLQYVLTHADVFVEKYGDLMLFMAHKIMQDNALIGLECITSSTEEHAKTKGFGSIGKEMIKEGTMHTHNTGEIKDFIQTHILQDNEKTGQLWNIADDENLIPFLRKIFSPEELNILTGKHENTSLLYLLKEGKIMLGEKIFEQKNIKDFGDNFIDTLLSCLGIFNDHYNNGDITSPEGRTIIVILRKLLVERQNFFGFYENGGKDLIFFRHLYFQKAFEGITNEAEKRHAQYRYYWWFALEGVHETEKLKDLMNFLDSELTLIQIHVDTLGEKIGNPETRGKYITYMKHKLLGENITFDEINNAQEEMLYNNFMIGDRVLPQIHMLAGLCDRLLYYLGRYVVGEKIHEENRRILMNAGKACLFIENRIFKDGFAPTSNFIAKNLDFHDNWTWSEIQKIFPLIPKPEKNQAVIHGLYNLSYGLRDVFKSVPYVELKSLQKTNPEIFREVMLNIVSDSDTDKDTRFKILMYYVKLDYTWRILGGYRDMSKSMTSEDWTDLAQSNPENFTMILTAAMDEKKFPSVIIGITVDDWSRIIKNNPQIAHAMGDVGYWFMGPNNGNRYNFELGNIFDGIKKIPLPERQRILIDMYITGNTGKVFMDLVKKTLVEEKMLPALQERLAQEKGDIKFGLLKQCQSSEFVDVLWEALRAERVEKYGHNEGRQMMIMFSQREMPSDKDIAARFYKKIYDPENPYPGIRALESVQKSDPDLLKRFFLCSENMPPELEKLCFDISRGSTHPLQQIFNYIENIYDDRNTYWGEARIKFLNQEAFSVQNISLWEDYVKGTGERRYLGGMFNCLSDMPPAIETLVWNGIKKKNTTPEKELILINYWGRSSGARDKFLLQRLYPEDDIYNSLKEWEYIANKYPEKSLGLFLECGEKVPKKYQKACMDIFTRFATLNKDIANILARTVGPQNMTIREDLPGLENIEDAWVQKYVPTLGINNSEVKKLIIRYRTLNKIETEITPESTEEVCRSILEERKSVEHIPTIRGRHVILIYPVDDALVDETEKNIKKQQQGNGKVTVLRGQRTTPEMLASIIEKSSLPLTIMYDGHSGDSLKLDNRGNILTMPTLARILTKHHQKRKNRTIEESPILAIGGCSSHGALRDHLYREMGGNPEAFPTLLLETEYGQGGNSIKKTHSPMGSYFFENLLWSEGDKPATLGTYIDELQRRKKSGTGITGEHPLFIRNPETGKRYELALDNLPLSRAA